MLRPQITARPLLREAEEKPEVVIAGWYVCMPPRQSYYWQSYKSLPGRASFFRPPCHPQITLDRSFPRRNGEASLVILRIYLKYQVKLINGTNPRKSSSVRSWICSLVGISVTRLVYASHCRSYTIHCVLSYTGFGLHISSAIFCTNY